MRFSTLTVVVFVAHASTLAIAAPLPFTDDVQDLVARGDDDIPAASSSGTPISASARWAQVASRFAKAVPPKLLNTPIPNNKVSAFQKLVGVAANGGSAPTTPRISPRPHLAPSPAVPQMNPAVKSFNQRGPSVFDPPKGPILSPSQQAVAQLKKNQAHPVTAAVEQLHRGQQSLPPGSSPARKSSTGSKAATAHKASSPARKGTTAHKPARKMSSVSHGHKEAEASQAHKVSQVRKAAAARKASAKKAKGSKLRKRDLEIDELD